MEFPEQYFHFDACKEKEVPLRAFKLQHLLSTKHIFEKYISHLLTTHMQPHTFCAWGEKGTHTVDTIKYTTQEVDGDGEFKLDHLLSMKPTFD